MTDPHEVSTQPVPAVTATYRLQLPDAAALVRLATSGLLTGTVRGLRLQLAMAPDWQVAGLRPPRVGGSVAGFAWRRGRGGLQVTWRWHRPREVSVALSEALSAVLRARMWDQTGGPIYTVDRAAWRDGSATWPQGRLAAAGPEQPPDPQGRPLGPYQAPPGPAAAGAIVTALANPYGRTLLGTATRYRLAPGLGLRDVHGRLALRFDPVAGPEGGLARGGFAKYAVVEVDTLPDECTGLTLRALASCGMVFTARDPAVCAALAALGLVTVSDPDEVADLAGYALSVQASRQATIAGDAALRRTALAGAGTLPLPGITAVISSMRSEDLESCLHQLAGQTYPALEAVIGLHGYDVPAATRQRWQELLPIPVRMVSLPAEQPFGAVLGRLTRLADGDLVTKLDDDDHYGPHHVTDLLLARHTSGADLVAKGARFVHLPERDETIDRAWAAPEAFDVTPAGGAMLIGRGDLAQVGGWSHSSKHVDADLLERVRDAGGLVYRTHAMEYVYVRRTGGHTFVTPLAELLSHAQRTYPGLPAGLARPELVATA